MRSMSTFLRTPFSEDGLKCINFYEGILTKYIYNSNNHYYRLQRLQLNKRLNLQQEALIILNKIPVLHKIFYKNRAFPLTLSPHLSSVSTRTEPFDPNF